MDSIKLLAQSIFVNSQEDLKRIENFEYKKHKSSDNKSDQSEQ